MVFKIPTHLFGMLKVKAYPENVNIILKVVKRNTCVLALISKKKGGIA